MHRTLHLWDSLYNEYILQYNLTLKWIKALNYCQQYNKLLDSFAAIFLLAQGYKNKFSSSLLS